MNDRIRKVIADVLGVPATVVGDDASPKTIESWDSLRQMSLIVALESEFNVLFDDAVVTSLQSFGAIKSALAKAAA
jgi:acyl carrier protein